MYDIPSIHDVRKYCMEQVGNLWEEMCRFENPHTYYVDLSKELYELKTNLLEAHDEK